MPSPLPPFDIAARKNPCPEEGNPSHVQREERLFSVGQYHDTSVIDTEFNPPVCASTKTSPSVPCNPTPSRSLSKVQNASHHAVNAQKYPMTSTRAHSKVICTCFSLPNSSSSSAHGLWLGFRTSSGCGAVVALFSGGRSGRRFGELAPDHECPFEGPGDARSDPA